ncbi:MAG: bifunctional phosphopantothenoylcysteine decarboxylase/phosphopantothenate--cysteine ligase CoaBC [Duncaniella sp.]|nr:bifunctional phosphopantothenoylcysteine decarboxylase/phosphopantothenate--cysteine ligase CoaBC [Duncaniella sp.]
MNSPLAGRHIVLGICGGIAAYKSVTLLRLFVKAGAEVQVVITPAGKEFITPVTLSALSRKPVVSEFFTANTGEWHSHVDLGLWADCMVIAPATASTLGKMAHGIADNMLVTTYLSAKSPVFIAPAMDLDMMAHPSTQSNLDLLRGFGNHIIEPENGFLASGLVGKGRMEEPENILKVVESYFAKRQTLSGKKVLITAGPTYERIDPVRFIGNFSSGKMGFALAEECATRGADVTVVCGPVSLSLHHPNITRIDVESASEMLEACRREFDDTDIAIMCAAVADYAPAEKSDSKIKREQCELPVIRLVKNPDIAATLGRVKRVGQRVVGFALETDNEIENAREKLVRKNLDMIVLNTANGKDTGFGTDTNSVTIFKADGTAPIVTGLKSKADIAADIVDVLI